MQEDELPGQPNLQDPQSVVLLRQERPATWSMPRSEKTTTTPASENYFAITCRVTAA